MILKSCSHLEHLDNHVHTWSNAQTTILSIKEGCLFVYLVEISQTTMF
jgi:hypothetical protein